MDKPDNKNESTIDLVDKNVNEKTKKYFNRK